ncbi:MAG: nicotinate-nucleotide adenylyltransferase [Flavobacteriales bacterium]|nr:nicotinate-nucleotide adenylyltransferase [Flavobacteriales bacterium]
MHIGLFFGSFNPIHQGHLIVANTVLNLASLDQVWFVVTPQNPFKELDELLEENLRLEMVNLAIQDNNQLTASDIEFSLPKPSYTIDTLKALIEKHKMEHHFSLIIGSDNFIGFHKWHAYEEIMDNIKELIVYPRPGYEAKNEKMQAKNIRILQKVPFLDLSATYIRGLVSKNVDIRYLTPDSVIEFIQKNNLY